MFKIIQQSKISKARIGKLKTLHGMAETPFFMPIATRGAVKNLSPDELKNIGASVVLSNTFHLFIKPGLDILKKVKGLHNFMGWQAPILTDSGGYQVFSLAKNRKITDEGVEFKSPYDGASIFFSPEVVIDAQKKIGSDILMVLDECPSFIKDKSVIERAVERTTLWAKRSRVYFKKSFRAKKPLLFGIVQGGIFKDLREKSAQDLVKIGFDGYAIGGLCLGEDNQETKKVLSWLSDILPSDKPRYQMGTGFPEQIVQAVKLGVDMFDCVLPTRNARHGELFVFKRNHKSEINLDKNFYEKVKIGNSQFKNDFKSLDKFCACYFCKNFTKAYLNHLFRVGEPLYQRLASLHNLRFYFELMEKIKDDIRKGKV
ncbi:MAG: tRNA guanosine(34) transglycosylase Tgt [Candidatus Gribaldobacteria bacterium]|nr:tRNA guanosine(34) transglycosylase Tgt [Candidatus Gribaldobacteria bacterium]